MALKWTNYVLPLVYIVGMFCANGIFVMFMYTAYNERVLVKNNLPNIIVRIVELLIYEIIFMLAMISYVRTYCTQPGFSPRGHTKYETTELNRTDITLLGFLEELPADDASSERYGLLESNIGADAAVPDDESS